MNKENLTTTDIKNIKKYAASGKIIECIKILRNKNAIILQNDCCIDYNHIKQIIKDEL